MSDRPDLRAIADQWSGQLDDLDVMPFVVTASIARMGILLERAFVALAREHSLRPGDLRVLLALRRSGPGHALSPATLFRTLMITSGAVSKQVDTLEAAGLVTRVADPDNLRGLLVRLEPEGRAIADATMQRICTDFCGLEKLDGDRLSETLRVLSDLLATVEGSFEGVEGEDRRRREHR
ncbi:MarR family winged helix-turn-helix transcriptional regulator [Streptomyces malaysiensis]|uniref:MarR family winged helix-turn-helix transcriptional regulator n=1 Tax=Streptomyces malaysiensis TaxID=92644 RepID=UPI002B29E5A9|nr:MarR family transcriptional regulator [Streptomyces malaysiensis]